MDEIIFRYHRYIFGAGFHRGLEVDRCLASSDNSPLLQETLKKFGLSEKLRTMRFDVVTEGAAGLFRGWDQDFQSSSSLSAQKSSAGVSSKETEQERKRRQLRESLRVFVKDHRTVPPAEGANAAVSGPEIKAAPAVDGDDEDEDETGPGVWNTPQEKVYCIKRALDVIASVTEDHLMHGQTAGFVQKKRSGKSHVVNVDQ